MKVSELAERIGISRSYLSTIFKKEMHMSPQEFLICYRMERAVSLLTRTNNSINAIAEEVGYNDALSLNPIKEFWIGFKNNFKQAEIYWLIVMGLTIFGVMDIRICSQAGGFLTYFKYAIYAMGILLVIITAYLMPVMEMVTTESMVWNCAMKMEVMQCICGMNPTRSVRENTV